MPPYHVWIEAKDHPLGASAVVYAKDPAGAVEPGIKAGLEILVEETTGLPPHHMQVKKLRPAVTRVTVKKFLTTKVLLDFET